MPKALPDRDGRILSAAVELAKTLGYQWITRDQVAEAAGVSTGSINSAYGTMRDLKRAVLSYAVEHEIIEIVRQGIGDDHEITRAAPAELKKRAAALMVA